MIHPNENKKINKNDKNSNRKIREIVVQSVEI